MYDFIQRKMDEKKPNYGMDTPRKQKKRKTIKNVIEGMRRSMSDR